MSIQTSPISSSRESPSVGFWINQYFECKNCDSQIKQYPCWYCYEGSDGWWDDSEEPILEENNGDDIFKEIGTIEQPCPPNSPTIQDKLPIIFPVQSEPHLPG